MIRSGLALITGLLVTACGSPTEPDKPSIAGTWKYNATISYAESVCIVSAATLTLGENGSGGSLFNPNVSGTEGICRHEDSGTVEDFSLGTWVGVYYFYSGDIGFSISVGSGVFRGLVVHHSGSVSADGRRISGTIAGTGNSYSGTFEATRQ